MTGPVEIHFLADHPEHVHAVAGWVYDQWGRDLPTVALEHMIARFEGHLHRNRLPLTVIALEGDRPVGAASLVPHDLPGRPDLQPWLSAVYVTPEKRRQGIGAQLVRAIEDTAARLGVQRLYLFTYDREDFYASLGWHTLEQRDFRGQPVVVMEKILPL